MKAPALLEIERQSKNLPPCDQWWLVEQILESLRKKADEAKQQAELAAMAADPAIQKEIHSIQKEFAIADADGLEGLYFRVDTIGDEVL